MQSRSCHHASVPPSGPDRQRGADVASRTVERRRAVRPAVERRERSGRARCRRAPTPSLPNTLRRWYSTVLTLTTSCVGDRAVAGARRRPAGPPPVPAPVSPARSRLASWLRPARPDAASSRVAALGVRLCAERGEPAAGGSPAARRRAGGGRPDAGTGRSASSTRACSNGTCSPVHRLQRPLERRARRLPVVPAAASTRPRARASRAIMVRRPRRRRPRSCGIRNASASSDPPGGDQTRRRTGPATARIPARRRRRGREPVRPAAAPRAPPPRRRGASASRARDMPECDLRALVAVLVRAHRWSRRPRSSSRRAPAGTSTAMPVTRHSMKPKPHSRLIATARSACTDAVVPVPGELFRPGQVGEAVRRRVQDPELRGGGRRRPQIARAPSRSSSISRSTPRADRGFSHSRSARPGAADRWTRTRRGLGAAARRSPGRGSR